MGWTGQVERVAEKYDKNNILRYGDLSDDITTWKIEKDSDSDTAVFWKWVFVHYQDKIVEYHSKTSPVFPSDSTPGKTDLTGRPKSMFLTVFFYRLLEGI